MFEMRNVPTDKNRGWTVSISFQKIVIDGKEVDIEGKEIEATVGQITISSKYGTLAYGYRPDGYDGWSFREQGGGGAATLPYTTTPNGELLVALVLEKRANMGDQPVWCIIGGFLDPGETHKQAQEREAAEEAGLDTVKAEELVGLPTNSNRAFFVADPNTGEGVHFYGLSLPFDQLELVEGGTFRLRDSALLAGYKKTDEVRFFPWRQAVRFTADALARSAIAQLLAAMPENIR